MYLFFDTETADLPKRWNAPKYDPSNWPRIVQLAWILSDREGAEQGCGNELVIPEGFVITAGAYDKHGISTAHARRHGRPLDDVLAEFARAVQQTSTLIAHNVSFDVNVVGAEFIRTGMKNVVDKKIHCCTMKESTEYCRLPGRHGFKWPTLTELYTHLFHQPFDHAHDALADCRACMRCFFQLQQLGVLKR